MSAVCLRRVDPSRNMRRFYRLDIEPDLLGGVLLMKAWGRIGAHGRVMTPTPLRLPPCNGKPNVKGGGLMPNHDFLENP